MVGANGAANRHARGGSVAFKTGTPWKGVPVFLEGAQRCKKFGIETVTAVSKITAF